jgi:hypothetical protein
VPTRPAAIDDKPSTGALGVAREASTDAAAMGPQNVLVVNSTTAPVPTLAQGTTTVAGTVNANATQSGTWNVGITGTPQVAQSGAWSVSAAQSGW